MSNANSLQLDLVTPEQLFFSGAVDMVEVPGELGDFGVLANHAPFVSLVRSGLVTVHNEGGEKSRLFVSGGVAEVNPEGCTILAEQAQDVSDWTLDKARSELEAARKAADDAITDEDKQHTAAHVRACEAIVEGLAG